MLTIDRKNVEIETKLEGLEGFHNIFFDFDESIRSGTFICNCTCQSRLTCKYVDEITSQLIDEGISSKYLQLLNKIKFELGNNIPPYILTNNFNIIIKTKQICPICNHKNEPSTKRIIKCNLCGQYFLNSLI